MLARFNNFFSSSSTIPLLFYFLYVLNYMAEFFFSYFLEAKDLVNKVVCRRYDLSK